MQAPIKALRRQLDTLSIQYGLQSSLLEEALDLLQECSYRINRIERLIAIHSFPENPKNDSSAGENLSEGDKSARSA